jgi:hypothetical protein
MRRLFAASDSLDDSNDRKIGGNNVGDSGGDLAKVGVE